MTTQAKLEDAVTGHYRSSQSGNAVLPSPVKPDELLDAEEGTRSRGPNESERNVRPQGYRQFVEVVGRKNAPIPEAFNGHHLEREAANTVSANMTLQRTHEGRLSFVIGREHVRPIGAGGVGTNPNVDVEGNAEICPKSIPNAS